VRSVRRRSSLLIVASLVSAASSFALSGHSCSAGLGRSAAKQLRQPAPVRCAYNPQPSKARPKKSKQPKEKVKGPSPAAVVVPEQTFFEGPPSLTETIIPGVSVLTVVGIIPFTASLARQAWTRYKISNRRIEVASGFQGKDVVQILYREVSDVKWLRRYGGAAGDIVYTLKDGSKLEMRSVSDFDRNLAFIMSNLDEETVRLSGYPDKPAQAYADNVARGEAEAPTLPPLDGAAPSA